VTSLYEYYCAEQDAEQTASTIRCPNLPLHINAGVHDVASTFKRFLAGLPGGILGSLSLFDALVTLYSQLNGDPELNRTKESKLRARLIALAIGTSSSHFRRDLICAVFGLLSLVGRAAETAPREDNRGRPLPTSDLMGYTALGIVFGPLLVGDLIDSYAMKVADPATGLVLLPMTPPKSRKERRKSKASEEHPTSMLTVDKIQVANSITEMVITHWREVVKHLRSLGVLKTQKDLVSLRDPIQRSSWLRSSASQPTFSDEVRQLGYINSAPVTPGAGSSLNEHSPTMMTSMSMSLHGTEQVTDQHLQLGSTRGHQTPDDIHGTLIVKKSRQNLSMSMSGARLSGRASLPLLSPTAEESTADSPVRSGQPLPVNLLAFEDIQYGATMQVPQSIWGKETPIRALEEPEAGEQAGRSREPLASEPTNEALPDTPSVNIKSIMKSAGHGSDSTPSRAEGSVANVSTMTSRHSDASQNSITTRTRGLKTKGDPSPWPQPEAKRSDEVVRHRASRGTIEDASSNLSWTPPISPSRTKSKTLSDARKSLRSTKASQDGLQSVGGTHCGPTIYQGPGPRASMVQDSNPVDNKTLRSRPIGVEGKRDSTSVGKSRDEQIQGQRTKSNVMTSEIWDETKVPKTTLLEESRGCGSASSKKLPHTKKAEELELSTTEDISTQVVEKIRDPQTPSNRRMRRASSNVENIIQHLMGNVNTPVNSTENKKTAADRPSLTGSRRQSSTPGPTTNQGVTANDLPRTSRTSTYQPLNSGHVPRDDVKPGPRLGGTPSERFTVLREKISQSLLAKRDQLATSPMQEQGVTGSNSTTQLSGIKSGGQGVRKMAAMFESSTECSALPTPGPIEKSPIGDGNSPSGMSPQPPLRSTKSPRSGSVVLVLPPVPPAPPLPPLAAAHQRIVRQDKQSNENNGLAGDSKRGNASQNVSRVNQTKSQSPDKSTSTPTRSGTTALPQLKPVLKSSSSRTSLTQTRETGGTDEVNRMVKNPGRMTPHQERPAVAQHVNFVRPPSNSTAVQDQLDDVIGTPIRANSPSGNAMLHVQIRRLQRQLEASKEEIAHLRRQLEMRNGGHSVAGTLSEQLRAARREATMWKERAEAAERRVVVFEKLTARLGKMRETQDGTRTSITEDSSAGGPRKLSSIKAGVDGTREDSYDGDDDSGHMSLGFGGPTTPRQWSSSAAHTEDETTLTERIRMSLLAMDSIRNTSPRVTPERETPLSEVRSGRWQRQTLPTGDVAIWMAAQEMVKKAGRRSSSTSPY
jgi:hypothetical protein